MAKAQWEEDAKDRFIAFLSGLSGENYSVSGEDVVVDERSNRNFDYELRASSGKDLLIALEIFRLIDNQRDLAQQGVWADVVHRLKECFSEHGAKEYLIRTPYFQIPKIRRGAYAKEMCGKLLRAMRENSGKESFDYEGFTLTKIENLGEIVFSRMGPAGYYNPVAIATASLQRGLETKNLQLNIANHLRIVLITSWDYRVSARDMEYACSQIDFSRLNNIDQLFFEVAPNRIELVFDRRVYDALGMGVAVGPEGPEPLFLRWLDHRLSQQDGGAFDLVKNLAVSRGGLAWMSITGRDALISLGEKLIEEKKFDDVLWIIRMLKADPDPAPNNSYHNRIAEGEPISSIVTIRGRLCWLVAKLIAQNLSKFYPEMMAFVEEYAQGKDFYVRQQATVPLLEMAVRHRSRRDDGSWLMTREISERVVALAWKMLRENAGNAALVQWVGHVFMYIRELAQAEALELLRTLTICAAHESLIDQGVLLLYFALFRGDQYRDLPRFDGAPFRDLLRETLRVGEVGLRSTLVWLFNKNLAEGEIEYRQIRDYVPAITAGEYEGITFHHLYHFLASYSLTDTELLCPVFSESIRRMDSFLEANRAERIWHFSDTWRVLEVFAATCSVDGTLEIIGLLLRHRGRLQVPVSLLEKLLVGMTPLGADLLSELRVGN